MKLMKIEIDGYEIELKVRDTVLSKHANEEDTLDFLNHLSSMYDDCSRFLMNEFRKDETKKFYKGCAERKARVAHELFEFCRENGLYDKQS